MVLVTEHVSWLPSAGKQVGVSSLQRRQPLPDFHGKVGSQLALDSLVSGAYQSCIRRVGADLCHLLPPLFLWSVLRLGEITWLSGDSSTEVGMCGHLLLPTIGHTNDIMWSAMRDVHGGRGLGWRECCVPQLLLKIASKVSGTSKPC